MNGSPLSLVLWSADVSALADFLVIVAEAAEVERHPGLAELEIGDFSLAIHADEAGRGHPWYDALAREGAARGIGAELRIEVSDVVRSWATAMALGAAAVQAPYDAEGFRQCQMLAPDGYLLSLWQQTPIGTAPLAPPPPARRGPFGSGSARPVIRRR